MSTRSKTDWMRTAALAALASLAATPALAYVGPGAGLSLLGALWGVLFAVFAALAFVVIWPIRRLVRRRAGRTYRMAPGAGADDRAQRS